MQLTTLAGLSILVIEDDLLLRKQVTAHLQHLEADVTGAKDLGEGRRFLAEMSFDFALLDVHLPDGSGLNLLRDRVFPPNTGVIVMTSDGGVSGAVEAIRQGALDYLVKPFDPGELPLVIRRAGERRKTARLQEHQREQTVQDRGAFFFGKSLASLETVLSKILQADRRMQEHLPPVLIQGETGTGKTTIARWLHHQGPRANQALVEMNCSALPESLAESELFGHEKGAFTDARSARIGLFEAADGGTLFLDELPSLSPGLQAKVLKAIEDHRIRRLGGRREIAVDVRIVAATSTDLRDLVREGEFREDLMHRLDLYRVHLPPLRERGTDIARLADHLLKFLVKRHRLGPRPLSAAGAQKLQQYRWPGNVRELSHELERALVFEEGDELHLSQLTGQAKGDSPPERGKTAWTDPGYVIPASGFQLEEAINRTVQQALEQTNHNVSAAARLLGVSRDYIRYRISGQKRPGPEPGK